MTVLFIRYTRSPNWTFPSFPIDAATCAAVTAHVGAISVHPPSGSMRPTASNRLPSVSASASGRSCRMTIAAGSPAAARIMSASDTAPGPNLRCFINLSPRGDECLPGPTTSPIRVAPLGPASARARQRLPRELLVTHRGVIGKHRDDGRVLHHVVALHTIDGVHVGVVRARVVFEAIDHELERWNP